MRATLPAVLALALLGRGGVCAAEEGSKAEADRLFREGREQLTAHHTAEACLAFERSQALDRALGTLMNLGDCYQSLGRTASAWRAFLEATQWAHDQHELRREDVCRRRVADLAAQLSRAQLPPGAGHVSLDGSPLELDDSGASAPIDPGHHVVRFSTGGREHSLELDVPMGPALTQIPLPPPDAPAGVVIAPPPAPPAPLLVPTAQVIATPGPSGGHPTAAKVLIATGAVLLAAGAAGVAYSWTIDGAVHRQQPGGPDFQKPTVTAAQYQALNTLYPASWAAAAAGAAALGGGLYFSVRAPSAASQAAAVTVGGRF